MIFEFMLAKKQKKQAKLDQLWKSEEWVAQEKFDGTRFALLNGGFKSRRVSVKTNELVDRTGNVPHLVRELTGVLGTLDGTILDGEVVHPRGFGNCRSAMGSGVERAIQWQKKNGKVVYKIFDVVMLKGRKTWKLPYSERHSILRELIDNNQSDYLKIPRLYRGEKDKREIYAKIIERGGEGIILKDLNAIYEFGRSRSWIKVKKTETYDVIITGYEEANRWYAEPGETGADGKLYPDGRETKFYKKGWIGAIKFSWYKDGELVEAGQCSGVSDEVREEISNSRKAFLGKVIEVTCQEHLKTGGLRHPQFLRFRDDKNPRECVDDL